MSHSSPLSVAIGSAVALNADQTGRMKDEITRLLKKNTARGFESDLDADAALAAAGKGTVTKEESQAYRARNQSHIDKLYDILAKEQTLNLKIEDLRVKRAAERGRNRRFLQGERAKDRRLGITERGKDRRLGVTETGKNTRLETAETGKDRRLGVAETGKDRRLGVAESGKDRRLGIAEGGKDRRNQLTVDTRWGIHYASEQGKQDRFGIKESRLEKEHRLKQDKLTEEKLNHLRLMKHRNATIFMNAVDHAREGLSAAAAKNMFPAAIEAIKGLDEKDPDYAFKVVEAIENARAQMEAKEPEPVWKNVYYPGVGVDIRTAGDGADYPTVVNTKDPVAMQHVKDMGGKLGTEKAPGSGKKVQDTASSTGWAWEFPGGDIIPNAPAPSQTTFSTGVDKYGNPTFTYSTGAGVKPDKVAERKSSETLHGSQARMADIGRVIGMLGGEDAKWASGWRGKFFDWVVQPIADVTSSPNMQAGVFAGPSARKVKATMSEIQVQLGALIKPITADESGRYSDRDLALAQSISGIMAGRVGVEFLEESLKALWNVERRAYLREKVSRAGADIFTPAGKEIYAEEYLKMYQMPDGTYAISEDDVARLTLEETASWLGWVNRRNAR